MEGVGEAERDEGLVAEEADEVGADGEVVEEVEGEELLLRCEDDEVDAADAQVLEGLLVLLQVIGYLPKAPRAVPVLQIVQPSLAFRPGTGGN